MNENIDLTKILRDCPTGWKFYSSIYGEVEFVEILPKIPIKCREREDEWLTSSSRWKREERRLAIVPKNNKRMTVAELVRR